MTPIKRKGSNGSEPRSKTKEIDGRMNTRHLEIFLAVCEAGSYSRAAVRLSLSQPGLSRIIRELEASQEIALFERTGRGVRLTDAGSVFRDYALRIIGELNHLKSDMQRLRGGVRGEVSVTIPMRVGRIILPPLVRRFSAKFPNAAVYVHENLNLTNLELVLAGKMDIGIFYEPPCPTGMVVDFLALDHLCLVGRPDLVGSTDKPITLADASSIPLVLPGRHAQYRKYLEKVFSNIGLPPSVVREVDTVDGLLSFALAGEGATILSYSNVFREADQGLVVARRIYDPPIARRMCISTKSTASNLVRETVTLLKQVVDENRRLARWHSENTGVGISKV